MAAFELLRIAAGILLASLVRPRRARLLWTLLDTDCKCCGRRVVELFYLTSVVSLLGAMVVMGLSPPPAQPAAVTAVVLLTSLGVAALYALSLGAEEG